MSPSHTLAGKIAIVSGSVGGGIGTEIAIELSSRGAHVVLNYPWASLYDDAVKTLARLETPGIAVESGLSTIEGPQKLVQEAVEKYGRIDILVNNASIAVNMPLEDSTLEMWDKSLNLNGRGYFLLTQAALGHLSRESRIVNIVSLSARAPPMHHTIYAGTKGMQECFTRVWARELPPKYGCTVNAVSPGPTRTPQWLAAPDSTSDEMLKSLDDLIKTTPVEKRLGEPEEIAFAVASLCEPRARWINGVNLIACGGLYID